MSDIRWIRVGRCEWIPPREGRSVRIGDRDIAVFNLGPSTELGARPSTALGTSPSTALGTRPSTALGTSPSTVLGASDVFLATDNECPHKGGPLCDGIITGRAVVCPLHGWKISLESGAIERPGGVAQAGVRTYPIRIDAGVVAVGVPAAQTDDGIETTLVQNCHQIQA